MACNHEDKSPVCDVITPNIPKILLRFSEILQQEYGISGFSVVEFKLDEVELKLDESLSEHIQLLMNRDDQEVQTLRTCCWQCTGGRCYGPCPR